MSATEHSALEKFMLETGGDETIIGERIAAVLEFLTIRAVMDGPYYITTDDAKALVIFAVDEQAEKIRDSIPEDIILKSWDDPMDAESDTFLSDTDPGDEQDEPASESE